MYPYQKEFADWVLHTKHYKESTLYLYEHTINNFYNYLISQAQQGADINLVKEADLRSYLNNLKVTYDIKDNTLNKYFFHLKKYFTFLYSHNLIDHYPFVDIETRKVNKYDNITTGWQEALPTILRSSSLSREAKLLLFFIAQGQLPKDILKFKYQKLHEFSGELKEALLSNIEIMDDGAYCFAKKFDENHLAPIATQNALIMQLREDERKLGMLLAPSKLRQSYIYDFLARHQDKTEIEMMQALGLSVKSLLYYRQNLVNVDFKHFSLPEDFE